MEVKSEKPITFLDVKQALENKEEKSELGYEQKITADYLKKLYKAAPTKIAKMIEALGKIEKLGEKHIVNIANFLPQDLDDLRILFSNDRIDLTPTEKQQILDIVKEAT